jgi:hypothetical protein
MPRLIELSAAEIKDDFNSAFLQPNSMKLSLSRAMDLQVLVGNPCKKFYHNCEFYSFRNYSLRCSKPYAWFEYEDVISSI